MAVVPSSDLKTLKNAFQNLFPIVASKVSSGRSLFIHTPYYKKNLCSVLKTVPLTARETFSFIFVKPNVTTEIAQSLNGRSHNLFPGLTMTSIISKFVTKTLCDHQGCLDLASLNGIINKQFTVAESVLHTVLFDKDKLAIRAGKQKAAWIKGLGPDSLIVAKTSLRLCQIKTGECSQCTHLHVCRYLVLGKCKFG